MRYTLTLGLALCVIGTVLPAQERVITPGGASITAPRARQCENHKIEMVDVRRLGAPDSSALPDEYRERVARGTYFYFNPPEAKSPRYTIEHLVAHADGTISAMKVAESSQNDYFDREATHALQEAARSGAFAPLPPGVNADSLPLELTFGRHAGSADSYYAKRTTCPAWPKPKNPSPDYPRDLREHGVRGIVRARFMVSMDGKIEPKTFVVLQATDQRFVRAVQDILPKLEYQPAEIQGRKVEQLTEQLFTFGLEYEPMN